MFKYVSDVSTLTHNIIEQYIPEKKVAVDATLGNGYDCDYLRGCFEKVFAFDIQKECCEKYNNNNYSNVKVINDSHEHFEKYIKEDVDCIIYNLGFLPGGDKSITTLWHSTINSISKGLELLKSNGLMLIAVYRGHETGKEEDTQVREYLISLPKNKFGVMEHNVINRSQSSPILFLIEKK